ncbi:uncharacterized protein PV07_11293 [Cladophialophora immunda]|uniref:EthD domain-containing protein n=1 Tax=Cladophialophora immunda TaxID=569365 RepID=A0A0D1Z661_9EURO|nr:uncharacterized protein PV07_11293 [Cladophialophora immunda]KIW23061.1 hypothetical protein PV07_11293 [Cladophialophora immunda]
MVFTVIITASKAAHLSAEQFKEHYETKHAPLVNSLCDARYKPLVYRRHYTARPDGPSMHPDFDAMTVLIFADEPTYRSWQASLAAGDNKTKIQSDCLQFLNMATYKTCPVEVRE